MLSLEGQLERSDGTASGTTAIPCSCDAAYDLLGIAGRVVFAATGQDGLGREPWAYDHTTHATQRLADASPGPAGSDPAFLGAAEGWAFFSADVPATGRELWRTDGTPAGTAPVADLAPGTAPGLATPTSGRAEERSASLGASLLFAASDGVHGEELWRSDGTAAGTGPVTDLRPGPLPAEPRWLVTLGSRVLFSADDGVHGRELWSSDGTAAGTALVSDLWPGPESGVPQWLTVVNGAVLFAATDGVHGLELWRTDGTPAGTSMLQDLAPGPTAGGPLAFKQIGDGVFFMANDGQHGFEPWRLPLDVVSQRTIFADGFETGAARRWSVALQ